MKVALAIVLSLILSSCATRLVSLDNSVHYQENDFNEKHNGQGFEVNVKDEWLKGYLV